MSFFSKLVRREFILRLVAFGVFANGLIILSTTLVEELFLRTNSTAKISSLLTSVPLLLGLTLIYLASLLGRRKYVAWLVVLPVYAGIFAVNVIEFTAHRHVGALLLVRSVLIPAIVVCGLVRYRSEFSVKSDIQNFRLALRTSLLVLLIAFVYGVAGFTVLDVHDFHQEIRLPEAAHRTIDQFDFTTDHELIPYTRRSKLFLDSLSILSTGAIMYVFISLFQPLRARLTDQSRNREQFELLLQKHAANSEDFFKLWPRDKLYFFNWQHTAGLAYHVYHGIALVVGGPSGRQTDFAALIADFGQICRANDWQPAYIHTEQQHNKLYTEAGFSLQKIGEEAVMGIDHFNTTVKNGKYFRQIGNKFEKQGYGAELLLPPHNSALIARLQEVSNDWLELPGRTERGFMMGYFSEAYLQQCAIMVLRDAAGTIQAFINQVPTYDKTEANYDLLRHTRSTLTNSNDFLLLKFLEHVQQTGYKRLNLGLCPLAGLENADQERTVIDSALGFVYDNGDRFYSFSGLHKFKAKYEPEWRGRYIAYSGGIRGFTRTVNALNKVISKLK